MSDSVLVIEHNHCYLTKRLPTLDQYQNQGLFLVPESDDWNYWKKNKYKDLPNGLIKKNIFDKIHMVHHGNYHYPIPANTEILINFGYDIYDNLPANIKIYCHEHNNKIKYLIFPIELKYLCLPKKFVDINLINEIKVPFGCKIILFGS